ncbi:hypothetical protein, partial [Enterobacter mori]|uniref:hypothetical protein n=1 Tax=Enterobacter mori TaxID=539813 RepID=UPI001A8D9E03
RTPTTSLKTSIKTITNLSDTNCLEIHGASLPDMTDSISGIQSHASGSRTVGAIHQRPYAKAQR